MVGRAILWESRGGAGCVVVEGWGLGSWEGRGGVYEVGERRGEGKEGEGIGGFEERRGIYSFLDWGYGESWQGTLIVITI